MSVLDIRARARISRLFYRDNRDARRIRAVSRLLSRLLSRFCPDNFCEKCQKLFDNPFVSNNLRMCPDCPDKITLEIATDLRTRF